MKLKADFVKDWHEMLKDIMVNQWGLDISSINDDDIPLIYLNAERRRVSAIPREVKTSDVFQCPSDLIGGWNKIKSEVSNGIDITLHLSKGIDDLESNDPMLNEWGIYHLHLGEYLNGKFIKRTGPVLYCRITNDFLYAINVYDHGNWTNRDLVEIIHRNWPESISDYVISGSTLLYEADDAERKKLRKKNVNSFVVVSDGTTYGLIGGGATSSGKSAISTMQKIKQHAQLQEMQKHLEGKLESLKDMLEERGYAGEPELEAKLRITTNSYVAYFPKYDFSALLYRGHNNP